MTAMELLFQNKIKYCIFLFFAVLFKSQHTKEITLNTYIDEFINESKEKKINFNPKNNVILLDLKECSGNECEFYNFRLGITSITYQYGGLLNETDIYKKYKDFSMVLSANNDKMKEILLKKICKLKSNTNFKLNKPQIVQGLIIDSNSKSYLFDKDFKLIETD
ncbi:hypothetical protein [Chryseobacterium sp. JUb7]|uniref:hypothetical protein n=1 Tax=Chryseobacterium sp. JUb7 TaxID=2940599 RepID=UPI002167FD8B|nr:hypothetical protein [Chryseobacterium sp. JUb7]MCS3531012.1 hypothetical protein [Chryseobacterium sp. JUb7]